MVQYAVPRSKFNTPLEREVALYRALRYWIELQRYTDDRTDQGTSRCSEKTHGWRPVHRERLSTEEPVQEPVLQCLQGSRTWKSGSSQTVPTVPRQLTGLEEIDMDSIWMPSPVPLHEEAGVPRRHSD